MTKEELVKAWGGRREERNRLHLGVTREKSQNAEEGIGDSKEE